MSGGKWCKNKYGLVPLFYVCDYLNNEMIHYLINKGADINAKNSNGQISLLFVYRKNKTDMINI